MKRQLSTPALLGILAVVVVILGVIGWKVLSPTPAGHGPDMMHWDPNKVPSSVSQHLKDMQAKGGKMPPP